MDKQFGTNEPFCTPSKSSKNHECQVRVVVRVRPFLVCENGKKPTCCISLLSSSRSGEVTVHLKDQETSRSDYFKLDAFFDQEDDNVSKIFKNEVEPLIPGVFHGYNSTVFAYGATGSGKTYTLQGSENHPGLMPLSMSKILEMCRSTRSTVKISYYEIYLEKCFDLLEPKGNEISVLDDKDGKTHLKGLSQVEVNSMAEFHEVFYNAIRRRKVAHTGLNDASSRSHGVLVIAVSTSHADGTCNFVTGKLNLIDLAGNEDNRRTCNEGIRLQESAKINQSLFTLSNVIYALNNRQRVPYRESKLTRILQDSLGSNSHSLMIACLNPGEYQESVNTVSLAARSCHISVPVSPALTKDTSEVKVDMEAKLRAWLESKGKTKSSQKMVHFASPLISKTPRTSKSIKKMPHSSVKPKILLGATSVEKSSPHVARRNLFQPAPLAETCVEAEDLKTNPNTEVFEFLADLTAVELDKNAIPEASVLRVKDSVNEKSKWFDSEELDSPSQNRIEVQSPMRKALSPISANTCTGNIAATDQVCKVTPYAQCSPKSADNLQIALGTPLDKFHSRSSNLKNVLIQEYIEFLNNASREELLEIKGIGHKMAAYIMELRQTSPLKSLSDLGKLGLSARQVLNMYGKAARGLLG
ncbi:hypothetical protein Leryth_018167 [Lithospermum erythrorhizon]|nr:hypothetical protein Leryth_018167 [Lithospermum erythrorhizon]